MKILFRKNADGFFSRVIKFVSRSPYSHVEIQPEGHPCVSSSEQDKGVRWAPWITGNPDKWDIFEVKGISEDDEEKIAKWCDSQVGKKYDWRGILQYAWPFVRNKDGDLDKWYCSEFCQRAIGLIHWDLLDHVVKNPGGLFKLLCKLNLIKTRKKVI